jgi:two-component sensor histidine kinase
VIPGIRESDDVLFEVYARVSMTGKPERLEYFVEALHMWFQVSVYSPDRGYFVAIFDVISERKFAEQTVKSLLAEKELILREVHHRVKNHMSTIYNSLALQAAATGEKAAKEALADAGSRVRSMLLLYDKLYQSRQFAGMSVELYLPPLIDEILANFPERGRVEVEKRIGDFPLDANKLQLLGIIVNELLTNIMKHAFAGRETGRIEVAAAAERGKVMLSVRDDGIGLPEAVDIDRSSGFGLMLVGGLTKQLGGSLSIERREGTRIALEFEG